MRKPLSGNAHTYFLPECDEHGYVTHLTLHAPGGFDAAARRAMSRLAKVWGAEGFDIEIILLATGQPSDFATASPYFREARVWESLTPFVAVRHAKSSRSGVPKIDPLNDLQIGSPEHDCWRLLALFDVDLPILGVSQLGPRVRVGLRDISCLDFQRRRRTGVGVRSGGRGVALRVELSEPTALPFGVGYGAHFGLGAFFPTL